MKTTFIILMVWVTLVVGGMAVYYAYTRWLPESVTAFLSGWKTKVIGALVAISPDVLSFLSLLQVLSADWEMSEHTAWMVRILGTTITVLRFITDKEQAT